MSDFGVKLTYNKIYEKLFPYLVTNFDIAELKLLLEIEGIGWLYLPKEADLSDNPIHLELNRHKEFF